MAPKRRSQARLPLEQVRWRLGTLWFTGSGTIFALLIVQSLTGVYEDRAQGVWGWALPNFLPTLSLMLGVFGAAALQDEIESDTMTVRKPFARLATALSVFHLVAVAGTLLAHPFSVAFLRKPDSDPDMMAVFELSNLWLGPLQGMVAAVIGALFFSKKSDVPSAEARGVSVTPPPAPATPQAT